MIRNLRHSAALSSRCVMPSVMRFAGLSTVQRMYAWRMSISIFGKFGVISQYTDGVALEHCNFMPKPGSGRTNAGFADFVHVSGCKGKVRVVNCNFSGAHDDPINVHGTHLRVMEYLDAKTLKIRFMHPQTYGFEAFDKGDEVELVNAETLCKVWEGRIVKAQLVNPREMIVSLNKAVPATVSSLSDVVIENTNMDSGS